MISGIARCSGETFVSSFVSMISLDPALLVAHDPAVGGGVERVGGEHRGLGALLLVGAQELGEEVARDQRVVAREQEDRVLVRQQVPRGIDRGRGPLALALLGDLDAVADALGHAAVRPDDRDDPIGARAARGIDDPREHGPAADRVQHLRQSRERIRVPCPAAMMSAAGMAGA